MHVTQNKSSITIELTREEAQLLQNITYPHATWITPTDRDFKIDLYRAVKAATAIGVE